MARFSYIAQNKFNAVNRGILDAENREHAIRLLMAQGLQPIKLTDADTGRIAGSRHLSIPKFFRGSLSTFDQIIIIRHLGIILSTGTDLLTGLSIIAKDSLKPLIREIMNDIKHRVGRGEKLSDAFRAWQQQFNPILPQLIKSGEASGTLPTILLNYSQEMRKDYTFVRKFRSAVFYPVILVSALFGMVIIILSFVAPRLKELFLGSSFKTAPPFFIRLVFSVSDFWLANTIPIVVVLLLLGILFVVSLKKRSFRLKLISLFRFFPIVSQIQRNITLMRFSKTIGSLLNAGFTLKAALLTTAEVVDIRYQKIIKTIADEDLEHGISLSDSMKKYPELFPDILISSAATGEKSGKLAPVFSQMSEFYEENTIYSLETFLTLLEPILLVIVGGIVALMAGALISPIYRSIGSLR